MLPFHFVIEIGRQLRNEVKGNIHKKIKKTFNSFPLFACRSLIIDLDKVSEI